jgi:DeoR family transcriptional regulator, aga operon transcriptional repressor
VNRHDRFTAELALLAENGRLEVDDLVVRLGISPATARRDLDLLEEQKLLTRTRGGAIGQLVAYDLPIRFKSELHADSKRRIAEAASALIAPGSVVGLCGGTTSTAIATVLSARADLLVPSPEPSLTVVTNAINIAAQLLMRPQIKIVVTGGVVQPRSYELVGNYADQMLQHVTLDIAFLGVNGIDPVFGASVHDEREANINSVMAGRAARSVVVADSSKIGNRAFALVGGPELFRTLITDSGITDEQRTRFVEAGYEVVIAEDAAPAPAAEAT